MEMRRSYGFRAGLVQAGWGCLHAWPLLVLAVFVPLAAQGHLDAALTAFVVTSLPVVLTGCLVAAWAPSPPDQPRSVLVRRLALAGRWIAAWVSITVSAILGVSVLVQYEWAMEVGEQDPFGYAVNATVLQSAAVVVLLTVGAFLVTVAWDLAVLGPTRRTAACEVALLQLPGSSSAAALRWLETWAHPRLFFSASMAVCSGVAVLLGALLEAA